MSFDCCGIRFDDECFVGGEVDGFVNAVGGQLGCRCQCRPSGRRGDCLQTLAAQQLLPLTCLPVAAGTLSVAGGSGTGNGCIALSRVHNPWSKAELPPRSAPKLSHEHHRIVDPDFLCPLRLDRLDDIRARTATPSPARFIAGSFGPTCRWPRRPHLPQALARRWCSNRQDPDTSTQAENQKGSWLNRPVVLCIAVFLRSSAAWGQRLAEGGAPAKRRVPVPLPILY